MRSVHAPLLALLLIALSAASASDATALCLLRLDHPESLMTAKRSVEDRLRKDTPTPYERADRPMDVLHYDLSLTVSLDSLALAGTVVSTVQPTASVDTLAFDLRSEMDSEGKGMRVTGVRLQGAPVAGWVHSNDLVEVPLPQTATDADTLVVQIDFEGHPLRDWILGYGLRNFFDRNDPQIPLLPDEPVLQSLSEPDAARSWWPCHDHPFDAATVTLSVTGPERFELAAPGLLVEDMLVGGGLRRQTWDMRTPIPSYLVSLNMADYVSWSDSVQVEHLADAVTGQIETRMLPLLFYAPSFEEAAARFTWAKTGKMIQTFAERFGPYPFADIKYGMSLFQFGGAMEHPTMSSMGQFTVSTENHPDVPAPAGEWVVAHELCHQWFGDAVRVERWGEIWLNEGIARWSEALWFELEYGEAVGKRWLDSIYRESYPGTVVDPGALFGTTVYNKGARIVHQLRQVLGDDAFFQALRSYMTDPALRFQAVNSGDFQRHCEAAYGESLDWFFTPWLHWVGRPSLQTLSYRTTDGAHLRVSQPADQVYRLPLPIRLGLADGSTLDRVVWIGETGQVTDLQLTTSSAVTSLTVDPDRDWLLDVEVQAAVFASVSKLLTPYPNPFNPQLSIPYFVSERGSVSLEIFDVRGRRVRRIPVGVVDGGVPTALRWDGTDNGGEGLASGVYFLKLRAPGAADEVRKVTLLR